MSTKILSRRGRRARLEGQLNLADWDQFLSFAEGVIVDYSLP